MQISDLLGHYNSAATQAKPITANKGVEKLTSSIEGLSKGNIFEGTVSSVKGGKVTLALSNGQTISARLDGKISLQQGQSMFFQVKSNNGTQVEIRPYIAEGSGNPTILQALKAANLPIETEFISMVNKMMEEKMPIDKASVSTMAKLVQNNSGINVETLVQLEKLGLPVNKEIASQFENYLNDKQAIGNAMEEFMNELPDAMADKELNTEQLRNIGQEIIQIVTDNLEEIPEGSTQIASLEYESDDVYVNTFDDGINLMPGDNAVENVSQEVAEEVTQNMPQEVAEEVAGEVTQNVSQEAAEEVMQNISQEESIPNTLGSVLSEKQINELSTILKEFLPTAVIRENTSVVSVLNEIANQLSENPKIEKEMILKLFSSEGFKGLVKDALEQQWMIEPKDVAQGEKLDKLYSQVKDQIERMEHAIKENGVNNTSITNAANNIKGNVEFMNQINQAYTYIQVPLKMSGQNASGELYVYTNKKNLGDENEDLSAFLHLDMDNLGSTDVSVKMHRKDVTTNFYLENDEAYRLIEQFLPQLDEKLKSKGYTCKSYVTNEDKHVNFVEDFLKKDQPSAGKLHRYSFDMRA